MYRLVFYFISLITIFIITFRVLRAINIENVFKKNKVIEIKTAYIIISLVISHVLSEIVLKFFDWASLILNQ